MSSVDHFAYAGAWYRMPSVNWVVVLCLFFVFIRFATQRRRSPCLPLPPGPTPVPFLGNAHQLPNDNQHETLAEWAKRYGEVLYARVFRQHVIVLSSPEATRALMEKRGAIYSGRPRFTFLCELCGLDYYFTFTRNTERWRRHRKWFQYRFQVESRLDSYVPLQVRETNRLLDDLLRNPGDFMSHIKRFSAALILELGYAHSSRSVDDDYVKSASSIIEGLFEIGNPGAMLVDCFPILRFLPWWAPGAVFKRKARQLRPQLENLIREPFRIVMEQVAAGTAKPSFAEELIGEAPPGKPLPESEEKEMSGAVGALYIAGTDTTFTVIATFVLAMTLHPRVFKQAQSEMDRVIGSGRLPDLTDRPTLPYLECVVKEIYRWGSPVPLGVAHALTEDDEYNGHFMPKGSTVISNIWAMTRDEDVYDNPEEFLPERFEDLDPALSQALDPGRIVFGFGRRVCPGRALGDTSVWLAMAGIVATFNICKKRDSAGREITPPPAFASGTVRHPLPFTCDIRPRSDESEALITTNNTQ